MLIHTRVCGFLDWAPCPPDTEITEDDVQALRVKQMADGAWHMKIEMEGETHNACNIPELAICDRMASMEKLGRPQSREATVAEILGHAFKQHLHPSHIVSISITDDGPDAEAYKVDLARLGVPDTRQGVALVNYLEGRQGDDLAAYLNVVFVKPRKKAE